MSEDTQDQIFICGFEITGSAVRALSWEEVQAAPDPKEGAFCWYHLNRHSQAGEAWLNATGLVPEILCEALFQAETRPRALAYEEGLSLNLRGVTPSHEIEDAELISLSLFASPKLLITTRACKLQAADELRQRLSSGYVPENTGALVTCLAHRTIELLEPVVLELDDEVDRLEDDLLDEATPPPRLMLAKFRRSVVSLRRYIMPQREAISNLLRIGERLIGKADMLQLRETQDRIIRLAEHLDVIRERAQGLQEQIAELRADAMNQRLFALAIVSAIFLPLGFVTGLFGVNLGGVPGTGSPLAFTLLCAGMIALTAGLLYWFRRMDWF